MAETDFAELTSVIGYAIELVGVAVIVFGALLATLQLLRRWRQTASEERYFNFRRGLGRSMMLGLEFLVAGDIIGTVVVTPSIGDVISLGLVVLIRTVLVFTIHLEVEGRWPWQAAN